MNPDQKPGAVIEPHRLPAGEPPVKHPGRIEQVGDAGWPQDGRTDGHPVGIDQPAVLPVSGDHRGSAFIAAVQVVDQVLIGRANRYAGANVPVGARSAAAIASRRRPLAPACSLASPADISMASPLRQLRYSASIPGPARPAR